MYHFPGIGTNSVPNAGDVPVWNGQKWVPSSSGGLRGYAWVTEVNVDDDTPAFLTNGDVSLAVPFGPISAGKAILFQAVLTLRWSGINGFNGLGYWNFDGGAQEEFWSQGFVSADLVQEGGQRLIYSMQGQGNTPLGTDVANLELQIWGVSSDANAVVERASVFAWVIDPIIPP